MAEITVVKSQVSSVEFHLRVKVSLFQVLVGEVAFFLIQLLEMPKFSFSLAMNFPPKSSLHFLYNFKASFEYRFKKFICGYNV